MTVDTTESQYNDLILQMAEIEVRIGREQGRSYARV